VFGERVSKREVEKAGEGERPRESWLEGD